MMGIKWLAWCLVLRCWPCHPLLPVSFLSLAGQSLGMYLLWRKPLSPYSTDKLRIKKQTLWTFVWLALRPDLCLSVSRCSPEMAGGYTNVLIAFLYSRDNKDTLVVVEQASGMRLQIPALCQLLTVWLYLSAKWNCCDFKNVSCSINLCYY